MSDRAVSSPDKQTLRTALQVLAAELGKPPTVVEMHEHGDYHPETYVDRFGSWDAALDAANLDPDEAAQKITDTELLSELQRLDAELGRPPKKSELAEHSKYSAKTYQNRFGSWNGALEAAMLSTHGVSDTELVRELQRLAEDLDRTPRPSDMSEQGNHGTVTYYRRFGSWDDALAEAGLDPVGTPESAVVDGDVTAGDPPTDASPIATSRDLARTYDPQAYADAWGVVEDYQRVLEYAAANPDSGSSAIATALNLPRSRIRPWIEQDARPDPVRAIQTADANGWLPLTTTHDDFAALNVLVAWLFSGGSINAQFAPSFAVDRDAARDRLTDALDTLGVGYDVVRESESDRATEVRPTEDASVLGRILAVVGVPQGAKNPTAEMSLPSYLRYASPELREQFVDVYLLNRGQTHSDKATITVREERSQEFLDELAMLFQQVAAGEVTISEQNIHLSAQAARNLYGKFGPPWA